MAMDEVKSLLKKYGTEVRKSSGHVIYRLPNGTKVSVRPFGRKGNQDQWKSALSYLKRNLRADGVPGF